MITRTWRHAVGREDLSLSVVADDQSALDLAQTDSDPVEAG
jgi:hypothetical protein